MMREGPEQGQGGCCRKNGQDEITVRAAVAQHCHPAFQKGQHKHWPASREVEVFHKHLGCTKLQIVKLHNTRY